MSKNHSLDVAFYRHFEALGNIASCVTSERVFGRPYAAHPAVVRELGFVARAGMRARNGGRSPYRLDFLQLAQGVKNDLRPNGEWAIVTFAYEYRLVDHYGRELLVYHWQPGGMGPDFSHLHASASLEVQVDALARQHVDLDKCHLITGQVSFSDFIRMLITDFDVRPLRSDWEQRVHLTT